MLFLISRVIYVLGGAARRHSSTFEPFLTERTGVENVTGAPQVHAFTIDPD